LSASPEPLLRRQPQRTPARDRMPRVPRDVEDDERDRKADDRIGDGHAESYDNGACEHAEADEAVNASVVAVCDESRAVESPPCSRPNLSRNLISDESDHSGRRQPPQVRQVVWIDEAQNRLDERDARADKDNEHNDDSGEAFATRAAKEEGEAERYRRRRIAEVVNQIGEERHAKCQGVNRRLNCRRRSENGETD
jgi:hypothetical protein